MSILGTICDDVPGSHNDTSIWLYSRGVGQCSQTIRDGIEKHDYSLANRMVFVFQVCLSIVVVSPMVLFFQLRLTFSI